jgi:AcrR family transcriptional regulator
MMSEANRKMLSGHMPPVKPKPKAKTKRTREEQLVAQAVQLFSHGGYRETSLQEIADKLGITRPLFYYYFETKEELLWRIIGHLGDHLLENARPIAASELSPTEKLPQIISAHVEALLDNVDAFRIYFAERHLLTGKHDRRLKRGENAYQELIATVITQGQETGHFRDDDPRVLTRLLTGMANSTTRWYVANGNLATTELATLAGQMARAALTPTD